MRTRSFALVSALVVGFVSLAAPAAHATARATARATASACPKSPTPAPPSGRLALDARATAPMAFEENVGQTDARVRYAAHGDGYAVFATAEGATLALAGRAPGGAKAPGAGRGAALRMTWAGAQPGARVEAESPLAGRANYMRGADRAAWRTDVATYGRVRYRGVYPGVDVVLYGAGKRLEYDFVVAPGADASRIRVRFEGADEISVAADGSLRLGVAGGEVRQERAAVYQEGAAGKRAVAARYEVSGDEVSLALGDYDRSAPLVVDPVVVYGDYIGGSRAYNAPYDVAVDASGFVYMTGYTDALDYPATPGAPEAAPSGAYDAFVTKLSPAADAIVASTYLGGGDSDFASGIALGSSGSVYVTGTTESPNFPTTPGAYRRTFETSEAFVVKFDGALTTIQASTFLGGGDGELGNDVGIDASGAVVAVGTTFSTDFPTTPGAPGTTANPDTGTAYVTKLAAGLGTLAFSTLLGGGGSRDPRVAIGPGSSVYVAGDTFAADFPTTPGAYDTTFNGGYDLFVSKIDTATSALVFSTYLGGAGGEVYPCLTADASGNVYVAATSASVGYPTTPGAYQTTHDPTFSDELVVTKFTSTGALAYSTFVGNGYPTSVGVDASGAAYVVGQAYEGYPTTPGAYDTTLDGGGDAFVTKIAPSGASLAYSTYLGGASGEYVNAVAVDAAGAAYLVGAYLSPDFPVTGPGLGSAFDGYDAFVTKLAPSGASLDFSRSVGAGHSAWSLYGESVAATAFDGAANVYLVGTTDASNFPVTPGAYDTAGGGDAFVTKLTPAGDIVYSTYLGGDHGGETASDVAVDATGAVYVTGSTYSDDFPTTPGAYDTTYAGFSSSDGFVTKLSPAGDALAYSTYLGSFSDDTPTGIAVDASGRAVVAGTTRSLDFPTTPGAYRTTADNDGFGDTFATKLNASGTGLVFSTYVVHWAHVNDVALDASGGVYVVGDYGTVLPKRPDGARPGLIGDEPAAGLFAKLDATGSNLLFARYPGGNESETVTSVAVASSGEVVIAGWTESTDFPTTPGVFGGALVGFRDAFVRVYAPDETTFVYSGYLGGEQVEYPSDVAFGPDGSVYVTGFTSSDDFPTTPGAFDRTAGGSYDAFLTRITPDGTALAYSTYFGAAGADYGSAVGIASDGAVYAVGNTASAGWLTGGHGLADLSNGYVVKLSFVADTVGAYVPATGAWFLRGSNSAGPADLVYTYGAGGGGIVPLLGDWNGDGVDTPGLYNPATGAFFLKNANAGGGADIVFTYGPAGAVPLVGDWDGDGTDTIGIYVPATGAFFLKNANAGGGADIVFTYGPTNVTPLSGDWDGDGVDSVGVYVASTGTFFLKNANAGGGADLAFAYGPAGATPLAGDWDGDGTTTVGVYVPATGAWFLRNANAAGPADSVFAYGPPNATPLVGDWGG